MRTATNDAGFLENEKGELMGFALGFDFCAEHEFGCSYIKSHLGIRQEVFPMGVPARTMTRVPEHLGFRTFNWRRRDKRFKTAYPCALLHMAERTEYSSNVPADPAKLCEWFGLRFTDPGASYYNPERDDVLCTWSGHGGFAIAVRGEQNVQRLQALHQAMTECRVSLADPSSMGFLRRSLSLVMNDAVSDALKAEVLANDEAYLRLYQALEATGIEATLKAAGHGWYAFTPAWRDNEGSELLVFLNPRQQDRDNHGWFTIPELQAWAQGTGPVVKDQRLEALLKEQDADLGYSLLKGLGAAGIGLRVHEKSVWMDEAKTVPGLRLLISAASRGKMADGNYSLAQLEPYLQKGRELRAAEKAEREAKASAVAATA